MAIASPSELHLPVTLNELHVSLVRSQTETLGETTRGGGTCCLRKGLTRFQSYVRSLELRGRK